LYNKKKHVERNYWKDMKNQRNFLDQLGVKLGLTNLDGWYSVQATKVIENGGSRLLSYYGYSLSKGAYRVRSELIFLQL
jgi:hypothetical protein